jgi:PEP-CTERM motif
VYLKLATFMVMVCLCSPQAKADFILKLKSSDFGITSTFNNISLFDFEVTVAGTLSAGGVYNNPTLVGVNYRVNGVLTSPTPSGFPAFGLVRSIGGAGFYGLSPDASLQFSVNAMANLSDGLQLSELAGSGTILTLNARELNQNPGRYHPPILTLNSNGTGRLVNANNMSTFPNPPPPIGSGMLVNVAIGQEYDVALSFNPSLTLVTVPEPSSLGMMLLGLLVTGSAVGLRQQRENGRFHIGSKLPRCRSQRCQTQ